MTTIKINGKTYQAQQVDLSDKPNLSKRVASEWYAVGPREAEYSLSVFHSGAWAMMAMQGLRITRGGADSITIGA